jgi:hypothetical protein
MWLHPIQPQRREEHEGFTKETKTVINWLPSEILRDRLRVLCVFLVESFRQQTVGWVSEA